jgi:hypothetical protein
VTAWLYPDAPKAECLEMLHADFGISFDMAGDTIALEKAGRPLPNWARTWMQSLRCFNAGAFRRMKEAGSW